eukprot:670900-Amphidinium_carterae.1
MNLVVCSVLKRAVTEALSRAASCPVLLAWRPQLLLPSPACATCQDAMTDVDRDHKEFDHVAEYGSFMCIACEHC